MDVHERGSGRAIARLALLALSLTLTACSDDAQESGSAGGGAAASRPAEAGGGQAPRASARWKALKEQFKALLELEATDDEGRAKLGQKLKQDTQGFVADIKGSDAAGEIVEEARMQIHADAPNSSKDAVSETRMNWLFDIVLGLAGSQDFEFFSELFEDGRVSLRMRRRASYLMGEVDTARASEVFERYFEEHPDERDGWCLSVFDILSRGKSPKTADFALHALKQSQNDQVLIQMAFRSRQLKDARFIPVLKEMAEKSRYPYVRINAAQSIADLVGVAAETWIDGLRTALPREMVANERNLLERGFEAARSAALRKGVGALAGSWN